MPSPIVTPLRSASILRSLTDLEITEFLPGDMSAELEGMAEPFASLDPAQLTAQAWADQLQRANPEILLACWATPPLPIELPAALRYVCYLAGSVRKLVTRRHLEDGLTVTNWGRSISRTVAEAALLHILTCLRGSAHWSIAMHTKGAWKTRTTQTASLFGRRVGLRGYGRVARSLIELLRPFGCDIGVLAPEVDDERARRDHIRAIPSLDALMAEHDVVVELAPLIAETRRSIQKSHLQLLRPGSVFVNVGRGATVDEVALEEIARAGKIKVGLDVFSTEPLPAASGLRGLPNVSLTPHLAGPTSDRRRDAGEHGLQNIRAFLNDEPLSGLVTLPVYDHST